MASDRQARWLLALLSLALIALPLGASRRQCITSYDVDRAWHLSSLHYENLRVGEGEPPVGHVNVTMRTDLNNHAVSCDAVGTDISQLKQLPASGVSWRNCTGREQPDIKLEYKFSWDRGGLYLETRMEWLCDNGENADPDEP
jgi:hypothetical protein